MATSVANFLVHFPEFTNAGTDLLAAQLAKAELLTGADQFDDQRDQAVYLLCADQLAQSPWGRDARMVTEDQRSSTYATQLCSMRRVNAVSALRLGVSESSRCR